MTAVTIEKRNNYKHITSEEFTEVYTDENSEYEIELAQKIAQSISEKYTIYKGINGHELSDFDKTEIESATNLIEGTYDFDCGDFTYYIEVK